LEAPALVASLDDVAVMRETIEQSRRHFRIAEHGEPFTEGEVRRDDDRCALVEPADQMEQELAAGLSERKIAEFVENDEVEAGEIVGHPALTTLTAFAFEPVDEIDGGEEATT